MSTRCATIQIPRGLPEASLARARLPSYSRCAMGTSFATRNRVQSLDRALEILKLLGSEPEMRVTDLARRLEVHKSTAFRLLATLQEHGLVEQNPVSEKYRLGYGLVRLAGSVVG